jgi:hypothetical protein
MRKREIAKRLSQTVQELELSTDEVKKRDGRAVVIVWWELIGKTRLHTSVGDVIDLVGG